MRSLVVLAALSGGCDSVFGLDGFGSDAALPHARRAEVFADKAGDFYQTVTLTLDGMNAGSRIVVGICRVPDDTTMVSGITDSLGDVYADLKIDGTVAAASASTWVGESIEGSSDPVDINVAFTGSGANGIDVRVVEYALISAVGDVEANDGNGTQAVSATVNIDALPTLVVMSTCVSSNVLAAGGFTEDARDSNGNVMASKLADKTGDWTVELTQINKGGMILDLVPLVGL